MSIKYSWSLAAFVFIVFFDVFYLDGLSVGEQGLLKSLTIIALGSICAFMSNSVYFMKLDAPVFGVFTIVISS
jgi:hypothetical protein